MTPPDTDNLLEKTAIDARLEALYREQAASVASALRREFGDGPPDPEDVTHQAFHKLIDRGRLDDIENLPSFLWRTARNLLLSYKRSITSRIKFDEDVRQIIFASQGRDASPESVLSVREQLHIIEDALWKMPKRRRDAFLMHRVEGLTLTETGRRLGVTRHAIVKHVARASDDIDQALNGENSGDG
ncbi:MAG: sigma-70 family RNA polymerase sigma factor [Pseudomonadota bacterium]